jgi:hypothetical protein
MGALCQSDSRQNPITPLPHYPITPLPWAASLECHAQLFEMDNR